MRLKPHGFHFGRKLFYSLSSERFWHKNDVKFCTISGRGQKKVGHILKYKAHILNYVPCIFSFLRGIRNYLKFSAYFQVRYLSVFLVGFSLLRMSVLFDTWRHKARNIFIRQPYKFSTSL